MKKALLSLLLAVAVMPLALAQDNTPSYISTTTASACGSYLWSANGQTYTTDTVAYYINATDDTLFVLSLTINHPFTSTENVNGTRCTYQWRGTTYNQPGLYSDTVVATAASGLCDSVFHLNLTLATTEYDNEIANACGSFTWHGNTYEASGVYSDTTVNAGCTHIDMLNLSIVTSLNVVENVEHCGDYSWYGETYTTSGNYTHTISDTLIGCDTVHQLNLTIVVDTARMEVDSACGSKTWRGTTYDATGLYSMLDTNATTHCVTYRSINLKIKTPRYPVKDTAMVGCNAIIFTVSSLTGTTNTRYNESATFDTTIIDHRWNRCYDSTIHLNVTIHKSGYDTTYVNACDSFYWNLNKKTYYKTPTTAPSYPFSTDTFGCDSMMTLMLTVKKAPVISAINGNWHLQAGETAVLYPTCTAGATYKWTYGNQTSTADTLTIPNVQGNVDVSLEATLNYPANGFACHDTSWITLVTFVGIDNTDAANISLYPNPTVGQLNIEASDAISQATVYNILGQQVLTLHNLGSKTTVDLTTLAKGTYTLHLALQNGQTIIRKFIINR